MRQRTLNTIYIKKKKRKEKKKKKKAKGYILQLEGKDQRKGSIVNACNSE